RPPATARRRRDAPAPRGQPHRAGALLVRPLRAQSLLHWARGAAAAAARAPRRLAQRAQWAWWAALGATGEVLCAHGPGRDRDEDPSSRIRPPPRAGVPRRLLARGGHAREPAGELSAHRRGARAARTRRSR